MKVLMVGTHPVDPDRPAGGVEAATVGLARALAKRGGVDLSIVSFLPPHVGRTRWDSDGYEVVFVPVGRNPMRRMPAVEAEIRKLHAQRSFDVVHLNGSAAIGTADLPRIFTVHGIVERDLMHAHTGLARHARSLLVVRKAARARDLEQNVICISQYVREALPESMSRRTWRINNPASQRFFDQPTVAWRQDLLYVGRLVARKDLATLLRAMHLVVKAGREARLKVVGGDLTSQYSSDLRVLARQLGVDNRVEWLGQRPEPEVIQLMSEAACLVLPSLQETAPMVIAEAMATGLPVVATDVGGVAEMLASGGGACVPTQSPAALADAIHLVLSDWERYSTAASLAAQAYRPEVVAEQTVRAYHDVCGG